MASRRFKLRVLKPFTRTVKLPTLYVCGREIPDTDRTYIKHYQCDEVLTFYTMKALLLFEDELGRYKSHVVRIDNVFDLRTLDEILEVDS